MASFGIHWAVGMRYLSKYGNIQDKQSFFEGIVGPDLAPDKLKSHYSGEQDYTNIKKSLKNKVKLYDFLSENEISSDYQKGVFVHLITDYLFFCSFFEDSYLESVTFEEFLTCLYYSYMVADPYIESKYQINGYLGMEERLRKNIKNNKFNKGNETNQSIKNILPEDKIDRFVEMVSDINLEDYKSKVLEQKENVFIYLKSGN